MKNGNAARANVRKYKQAQKDLEATYFYEQQKCIQSQTDRIENASENKQPSLAWQTVNEITGRKKFNKGQNKSIQPRTFKKWMNHFQNLLGKSPIVSDSAIEKVIEHDLEIKTGPFNEPELDLVLNKLQNKKAAGLDGIPPEVWKTGKFNDLLYYCNEVYKGNVIQSWTEVYNILPFPKKGDLSKTSNYRGITLTSIAAKIYNALSTT